MDDALPISPERLLTETKWLRSLARSLAQPADADDLAQEAWLRAIEQPPGRIRGLRPWLRTVLRRAHIGARQSGRTRTEREREAVRPATAPSAGDLAAQASLHRAVVDAVLSLDEPGRSTILLRFFGDVMPRDIARIQGVSYEAVRTRLRRALAALRARLDRDLGGRKTWSALALTGLFDVGVPPGSGATAAASVASATSPLIGVLAMSLTAKVCIGVACALLLAMGIILGWHFAGDRQTPANPRLLAPRAEDAQRQAPAAPEALATSAPRAAPQDEEAATSPPATTPAPSPRKGKGALEGRVLLDPFVSAKLIGVEWSTVVTGRPAPMQNLTQLNVDGSFRWELEAPATVRVTVGATGVEGPVAEVAGIEVAPGSPTRDPRLDPLDLRGMLRLMNVSVGDGEGQAVPDARVFVEPRSDVPSEYGVATKNGSASMLTTGRPVNLRVEATGFRTARVQGVAADVRVVLRRGPRITVRFDRELAPLPAGIVPIVWLTHVDDEVAGASDDSPFLRRVLLADGRVRHEQCDSRKTLARPKVELRLDAHWASSEVAVPEPGSFEVALLLERATESGGRAGMGVEFTPPLRILVEDHDRPQSIAMTAPDDTAISKSLEMLKKRER